MAHRKSSSTATLDPTKVCTLALKQVKSASDYHRLGSVNSPETLTAAWEQLSEQDQQRITDIVNADTPADPQTIASELMACGTRIELQTIKSQHGELAVKAAWKLLSTEERNRLTSICQNGQHSAEETQPMTEEPATYNVEPQHKPRSLFNISDDLERLNDLLDEVGDDTQQQELLRAWFEQVGDERDRKLDAYAALITEMAARAAIRKVESQRLQELANSDENRARLLKDRLKRFFETHNLKTIETLRYKLQLAKNGGKAPLIMDESVPAARLPEQFQKVSIDPNTAAIREALERGEHLNFAQTLSREAMSRGT